MGDFQKFNKIKNQKSPGKAQISIKSKNWPGETIFLPKTRFLPKTIFIEDKNLPQTKKIRLGADFSLDHTGGWGGGVSNTMIMIGNFRVIKELT